MPRPSGFPPVARQFQADDAEKQKQNDAGFRQADAARDDGFDRRRPDGAHRREDGVDGADGKHARRADDQVEAGEKREDDDDGRDLFIFEPGCPDDFQQAAEHDVQPGPVGREGLFLLLAGPGRWFHRAVLLVSGCCGMISPAGRFRPSGADSRAPVSNPILVHTSVLEKTARMR